MRILALLIVVAIVCILVSKHAQPGASKDVKAAMAATDEAMGNAAGAAAATPAAKTVYKQALDRAHAVARKMEDARRLEPEP